MLHIVHLLERRFPERSARIVAALVLFSAGMLVVGVAASLQ